MSKVHKSSFRVYYQDTDAGGIMYHANYLNYAERGRSEMTHHVGMSSRKIVKTHECQFVNVHCEMDWHAPAYLDDMLTVATTVAKITRSTVHFHQDVLKDDKVICHIKMVSVCVNMAGKAVRLPNDLRALMESQAA